MSTDTAPSSSSSADAPAPGIGHLGSVVLDCADAPALAEFYAALVGWQVEPSDGDSWVNVTNPAGGVELSFQPVADYVAPAWPGTDPPQQFHLDVYVADLDAGDAAVLALGATKHDHQPGETFRVYLDPQGHPFCLCQG